MKPRSKELDQLKAIILDPKTSEEEKKRFQIILDRIEGKTEPASKDSKQAFSELIGKTIDKIGGSSKVGTILSIEKIEKDNIKVTYNTGPEGSMEITESFTDSEMEKLSKGEKISKENVSYQVLGIAKKRSHHKKKGVVVAPEPNLKAIPDCDELVAKYKERKKTNLKRKLNLKKDHRAPDTKLRDEADKKVTAIINNLKKLSIKNKVSGKVKKDILTILKAGINHVNKTK